MELSMPQIKKVISNINCFKNDPAYQVRLPCKRAVLLPSSNYRPTCQATDKDPIIINWFTPKYGLKEDGLPRFDAIKKICRLQNGTTFYWLFSLYGEA